MLRCQQNSPIAVLAFGALAFLSSLCPAQTNVSGQAGVGQGTVGLASTGIQIFPGDTITVAVTGTVTAFMPGGNYFDANGEPGNTNPLHWVPSANTVQLIGVVGSDVFTLGVAGSHTATDAGTLKYGVNDHYYFDNGGVFVVTTTVAPYAGPYFTLPGSSIMQIPTALVPGPPTPVYVPATSGCGTGWVATGITPAVGSMVNIVATGQCTAFLPGGNYFGPDGEAGNTDPGNCVPAADLVSLVGDLAGTQFKVGAAYTGTVLTSGPLSLGVNDNFYLDNGGTFLATVTNGPMPPAFEQPLGLIADPGAPAILADLLFVNESSGANTGRIVQLAARQELHLRLELPDHWQPIDSADYALFTSWNGKPRRLLTGRAPDHIAVPHGLVGPTGGVTVQALLFDARGNRVLTSNPLRLVVSE